MGDEAIRSGHDDLCPRCGEPTGLRPGEAAAIARRQSTDRVDEYGRRLSFVPVVKCVIAECTNLDADCTYQCAGFFVDGVFVEDPDLAPLAKVWSAVMDDNDQYRGGT